MPKQAQSVQNAIKTNPGIWTYLPITVSLDHVQNQPITTVVCGFGLVLGPSKWVGFGYVE